MMTGMQGMFGWFAGLWALIWLVVVVYMIVLATRLVNAVEEIARKTGTPQAEPPRH